MSANMQKIKLLKLYELLYRETDEDHPISRVRLCERLNEMGISSNVRTLSLDIEVLCENGYEIMSFLQGKEKFYYVPERELSVLEIKILIDAVQAASFVTERKTADLIKKLASLCGSHNAELLKGNMVCFNTRKHSNESILYTIDCIETAISRRKMIAFSYFHLNELVNEDNYYLMAYSSKHPDSTANYRIDRMDQVEIVWESELSQEALARINSVSDFTEQAFKMFAGERENVMLRFDRSLMGSVYDKFGEDTPIEVVDETFCTAMVYVLVSPTFFGWLAQFGNKMKVLASQNTAERYLAHIREICDG